MGIVASTGCVGNRVYTDMDEDDLYVVIRGKDLAPVSAQVETIATANAKLFEYHRNRRETLATE